MNHPQEKTGEVQLAASDESNVVQFIGLEVLKKVLGIDDLEERISALEGNREAKPKMDRMKRGQEDR